MISLFKQLMKKMMLEYSLLIIPFLGVTALYSLCFFQGIEKLTHISLGQQFPTSSNVFIFFNTLIWFFLLSSIISRESMKFLPFILGSIIGLVSEFISFLGIRLNESSNFSYLSIDIIGIAIGGIVITLFGSYVFSTIFTEKEKVDLPDELTEESEEIIVEKQSADIQPIFYLDLKNYEYVLDNEVKDAVLDISSTYDSLAKHTLSIHEHHVLTRSHDQLYTAINEFIALQYENKQKIKPTLLTVLADIEQEAHDILDKKENERMEAIVRISSLRKEKNHLLM